MQLDQSILVRLSPATQSHKQDASGDAASDSPSVLQSPGVGSEREGGGKI